MDPANVFSANQSISLVNHSENLAIMLVDASCSCGEYTVAVLKKSYDGCLAAVEDERPSLFPEPLWCLKYLA